MKFKNMFPLLKKWVRAIDLKKTYIVDLFLIVIYNTCMQFTPKSEQANANDKYITD